jgi:hypothetical protein
MGIQKGIIKVLANNGNWTPGPVLGPNDQLTLNLADGPQAVWSVIAGKWGNAWGDIGYPGGGQYAAPGLPQGALIISDGSRRKQSWPAPPQGFVTLSKIRGPVSFIANDEPPHDGFPGYLDNEGWLNIGYQWASDDFQDSEKDYVDPTPA